MTPTPMMQQYLEIKSKYVDYILFFRLGDFYEMFYDDAILVSRELELTLTGKDCGLEERAPMCGIPYHAVNTYIPKLIERGYKIAICEQVEDPKTVTKGIVKRDVVKIITPGTVTEGTMLDDKKNNYIAAFLEGGKEMAFAYADITTGEVYVSSSFKACDGKVIDEMARVAPSEIIVKDKDSLLVKEIVKRFSTYVSSYNNTSISDDISDIVDFDILNEAQKDVIVYLLNYIVDTQKSSVKQINVVNKYEIEKFMQLDVNTRKNLEIVESNREKTKKGSLLWVLDKTITAMGSRELRNWIQNPLLEKDKIEARLNTVEVFTKEFVIKDEILGIIKNVYDIERIISKVVSGSASPRDLISLKNSLVKLPELKELLVFLAKSSGDLNIVRMADELDTLRDIYTLIDSSILEDAPLVIKEGGIIKSGFDSTIDEYKEAKKNGRTWLMELEAKEKEATGIKMLKVGYNRIFGYYIEVTNSYKSMVPKDRYIAKQTLAGCERYIVPELKELENKIISSEEKLNDLEYETFVSIRQKVGTEILRVQKTAKIIASLDTLIAFAGVAMEYSYVKPTINDGDYIKIKDGRHPVVEKALRDIPFISNDTFLNSDSDMISIITGPNMAGKSTYMRQVALISYMAQIGCFVPAKEADLCIVDRIFTRIGASDDLSMGESTFMVEMSELSNILKNATSKSLVILDEIGRGTSTYDGLAIAWSTIEYILEMIKCKTLFATHYHELTELDKKFECIKNYSVETEESGEDVIFLHKIINGAADESYGIYVAKLAGLPKKAIKRAKAILKEVRLSDVAKKKIEESKKVNAEELAVDMFNYTLNEVADILKTTDLDELAPRDGLALLYKLKEKLN